MKRLFSYLSNYPWQSFFAPFFKMSEALFDLLVPMIVIKLIDGVNANNLKAIYSGFAVLLLLGSVGFLCCVVGQYFSAYVACNSASALRKETFKHINELDYQDYDQLGSATLITRMSSDINLIQNGINLFLRLFLRSPFIVFGCLIMAFTIDRQMGFLFLILIILLAIVVISIMIVTNPLYQKNQGKLDELTSLSKQSLSGVRVIRAFNQEENTINNFNKANNLLLSGQKLVGKIAALLNPLTYVLINIALVIVLKTGGIKVNVGSLSSGQVIALTNYLSQILVELVKLANLVVTLAKAIASISRVEDLLAITPEMQFGFQEIDTNNEKAYELKDVNFIYKGSKESALSQINLTIKKGQMVGIIGSTGCGKTTLVNVLARLYDVNSGEVKLFGKDIKDYSSKQLRKCIAIVPQKSQLLNMSIKDNLLLGNKDIDEKQIQTALRIGQAQDFVQDKGLDFLVQEGGSNFSGGQRQRLCIARAILRDPAILILDDANSGLDYLTDAKLRSELKKLADVTTLIISQRINCLADCDQIVVLDEGKVVGVGKHEQLLKDCPIYHELYVSQNKD